MSNPKHAQHFEAIKCSLRQSKDGVVVAFVVQPDDVRPELLSLPVGSRVMIAWSQIGDDEKPIGSTARPLEGNTERADMKHLGRYVDEFAFRLNDGNVNRHTLERLDSFVTGVVGKRLTYKQLIH